MEERDMATTADARSSRSGYSKIAIALHWTIALMIIGNVIGAFVFDGLLDSADPAERARGVMIVGIHKSIGLTVLVLSLLRLLWRLTHGFPRLPEHMARWEIALARANHLAFYVLMIAVPVAGYVMVSAGRFPLTWFGLFAVPKLPVGEALGDLAHEAHEILAFTTVALVGLHVAGALKHHFLDRDDVLARMLPLVTPRR
jgi:cytochrome b561